MMDNHIELCINENKWVDIFDKLKFFKRLKNNKSIVKDIFRYKDIQNVLFLTIISKKEINYDDDSEFLESVVYLSNEKGEYYYKKEQNFYGDDKLSYLFDDFIFVHNTVENKNILELHYKTIFDMKEAVEFYQNNMD